MRPRPRVFRTESRENHSRQRRDFRADGRYDLTALDRVYHAEAAAVAARYDARNGNDYYTRQLAGLTELEALARPHPLPSPGGGR